MSVFVVGGLPFAVEAPAAVEGALAERYGAFVDEGARAEAWLRVGVGVRFVADFRLDVPEAALRVAARRDGDRVVLGGGARGWFDPARGEGALDGATHLGEVDALVRLTLSLLLPRRGALLMHGTAVPSAKGVAVLIGASGAGKSTAAAALGSALGDELIVLHPTDDGADASGTPYWRGGAGRHAVASLGCLARAGAAEIVDGMDVTGAASLTGSAALRAVLPHVVRYVVDDVSDRAIFTLVAAACAHVPVRRLVCPEGRAFIPFLRRALATDDATTGPTP